MKAHAPLRVFAVASISPGSLSIATIFLICHGKLVARCSPSTADYGEHSAMC